MRIPAENHRALMPDYLRLIALFGIVIVNVQFIAFSSLGDLSEPVGETVQDAITLWLVNGLALLKTYGLFSFMFGVGLGFLMQSAQRRGLAFGKIYRNRMCGLLLLGLFHGFLFFPGDILVIYSITGSVLYFFRNWGEAALSKIGGVFLILQPFIALAVVFMPSETSQELIQFEKWVHQEGRFLEAVMFRSIGFAFTLPVFLIIQGLSAFGWFCLGLASVKSGLIDQTDHPLWRRARRLCLGPGVALGLLGAALWQWGPSEIGIALTIFAAPIATLGYLGVIALLSRPRGRLMDRMLAAGGASLSIYLSQSLILTTVFSAYGAGLWGAVGQLTAVLIALLVTVALIAGLSIWRIWFKLGPFEWLLRKITYAGAYDSAGKM